MDGSAMNIDYLLKLKAESNLTNEQLAQISGIPESTLARILNGRTDNPYFQTIVDLVRAMKGSVDEMEGLQPLQKDANTAENAAVDNKLITLYREILNNKERWIRFLAGVLLAVLIFILIMVTYDILHHMKGWIQY